MKRPVLVACGVLREARIAEAAGGVVAVAGGGDGAWLEARLEDFARADAAGVMSFGLCGALVDGLRVGDAVIGSGGNAAWTRAIEQRLDLRSGTVFSDGTLAAGAAAKRAIRNATGAIAIDMESHIAARVAARHGLPFLCLRVVSDGVEEALPPAFAVAMRRGGGTDLGAMLRSLATRPRQIPAFARASANAVRALKRLELLGGLLGPRLGLPDLG